MNAGGFAMVNAGGVDDPQAGEGDHVDDEESDEDAEPERVRIPFSEARNRVSQRMLQNYAFHTGQEAIQLAAERAAVKRANAFLNGGEIPEDDGRFLMQPPSAHRGPIIASMMDDDDDADCEALYGAAYRGSRPKASIESFAQPPPQTPEFDRQCAYCKYSTDHDARLFQPLQTLKSFVKNACNDMDFDVIFEQAHIYYTNEVWLRAWKDHGRILPKMDPGIHYAHFFNHISDMDIQLARDIRDMATIKTTLKEQIYFSARGGQQVDPTVLAAFTKIDDTYYKRMTLAETRRRKSTKGRP